MLGGVLPDRPARPSTLGRGLALVAALTCSLPATAGAQSASDRAEADALFRQGIKARDEGDCFVAAQRFRRSHELVPGKGKLLNVALCEEKLGLLATASAHFKQLLPAGPGSKSTDPQRLSNDDERVAIARQHVAALAARVPYVCLSLAKGAPPGTEVKLDGATLAAGTPCVEAAIDPGKRVLIVTAPRRAERRVEVAVAEGKRVELTLEPGASTDQLATPRPEAPPSRQGGGGRTVPGLVVGGLGVAALAVGGVTGVLALVKHSDGVTCSKDPACSSTTDFAALNASGKTLSLVSTVTLIAGTAAAGAGLYLLLSGGRSSAQVGLTVDPAGGRLGLQGAF